ncbi:MAG: ribosomal protein S18-alanine N-acetyltransferase [Clostridia bacterium]|nr:ribosomal protein S18-alanine N-acetyltransferase [Clostridia bacterium]
MMNIIIEKMGENYLSQIAELEKTCFSTPWSENALREELANQFSRFFVALCDGQIAGYIGAHNVVGEVYITNVAVFPQFRRQGIAEALIKKLMDLSQTENAEFITLEVRKSNIGAINLYTKMGFKEVGSRKNFYENPREDALLMTYRGEI